MGENQFRVDSGIQATVLYGGLPLTLHLYLPPGPHDAVGYVDTNGLGYAIFCNCQEFIIGDDEALARTRHREHQARETA